jgi:hypothetical protein
VEVRGEGRRREGITTTDHGPHEQSAKRKDEPVDGAEARQRTDDGRRTTMIWTVTA